MHVLLISNSVIPVHAYGGTERVIWDLGKTLVALGHRVSYLVAPGSHCPFGPVLTLQPRQPWDAQIPPDVDVAHFQFNPDAPVMRAHLVTEHGNARRAHPLPLNTVFVSRDHAARYGSREFVHNGLDWSAYGDVDLQRPRQRYHFLGKAAWSVKNVRGAIAVARRAGVEIDVLGGDRLNVRRGLRWTLSRRARFHGMVGGARKNELLHASRGLIFPVRWHEPFGLAVIESLYFGAAVFATPYGALPELVPEACGVLAASVGQLAEAVCEHRPDPRACHHHAVQNFNAQRMANDYLRYYERIAAGETLHRTHPMIQASARNLPWRR